MFTYYGTKASLAHLYPPPTYDIIVEPFAGAAAYSMLHHDKEVHLYDINLQIVRTWKWLIGATPGDCLALPILQVGQSLDEFVQLSLEEKLVIGWFLSASPANSKTTATSRTGWTHYRRACLARDVAKVKHWTADFHDFREVPKHTGTWFVDPPYQDAGKHYMNVLRPHDYKDLGTLVHSWPGQVIVCEKSTATWLDFKPLVAVSGQTNISSVEGIYCAENLP